MFGQPATGPLGGLVGLLTGNDGLLPVTLGVDLRTDLIGPPGFDDSVLLLES